MAEQLSTTAQEGISPNAILFAQRLMETESERHKVEDNVRIDLVTLLNELNVGTIEAQYQTGAGPADIYLPNKRTLIETKAYPLAEHPDKASSGRPESPLQQLTRYVCAELTQESTYLELEFQDPMRGVITDGRYWHFYVFPVDRPEEPTRVDSIEIFTEVPELVRSLLEFLGGEMVGKEWIPAEPRELFIDLKEELDTLYTEIPNRARPATSTKFSLWLDTMKASGMVPEDSEGQTRLFLSHTFLVATVRMVSYSLRPQHNQVEMHIVLQDSFASWVLDFERGSDWLSRLYSRVAEFDWRRRHSDVLRELYQAYVSAEDRKLFGEFYTPDWLAEYLVDNLLDPQWIDESVEEVWQERRSGVGLLDPACGSGTFLYHAALKLARSESLLTYQHTKRADIICRLLNGIDIHPVAVEICRVNLERALPTLPSDGLAALQVFLGDSLQLQEREEIFKNPEYMSVVTPGSRIVDIPMTLVRTQGFTEYLRRMVLAAVNNLPLPKGRPEDTDQAAIDKTFQQLKDIVAHEGDSVWTWYCANLAGPYLLAERKVNRVIANPPWVKLSDIQVADRKLAMESLGDRLGLQAGGKQAPHLDIASFFVIRVRDLYLSDSTEDRGAWIVKASALRSGQWQPFREHKGNRTSQTVDLVALKPFGGGDATRSCLLLEHFKLSGFEEQSLIAQKTVKKRIERHDSLFLAKQKFRLEAIPEPLPQAESEYLTAQHRIRQGATIVPYVLSRIERQNTVSGESLVQIETKRSTHPPWRQVSQQRGLVPAKWIKPLYVSSEVYAYAVKESRTRAVIPIENGMLMLDPGENIQFWRQLEEVYEVHRGKGQHTPLSLVSQFDYFGKLSGQLEDFTEQSFLLLYPSSGDHMRAVRVKSLTGIVDSTMFWQQTESAEEAGFLTTLLNASCLNRAFAESRSSGRHFQLHPWRKVPIPRFKANNDDHIKLASLCGHLEEIADSVVADLARSQPKLGQVGITSRIRQAIADSSQGREVERIVKRLLPDQTS